MYTFIIHLATETARKVDSEVNIEKSLFDSFFHFIDVLLIVILLLCMFKFLTAFI